MIWFTVPAQKLIMVAGKGVENLLEGSDNHTWVSAAVTGELEGVPRTTPLNGPQG